MAFRKSSSEVRATSSASGYDTWPRICASTLRRVPLPSGRPPMPDRRPTLKTSAPPLPGATEGA
eukprot:7102771-Alexandrium_andersonii.AAC.1